MYAGSFDPPTLGHKGVVEDCLKIFDEVVIAILYNPAKEGHFTLEQRVEMLRLDYGKDPRIKIRAYEGTTAALLKEENASAYVKGVRNATDYDYETADFYASCKLDPSITAVYIPARQHLLHVSSSMVRNSLHFGTPIDEYVSPEVKKYLEQQ